MTHMPTEIFCACLEFLTRDELVRVGAVGRRPRDVVERHFNAPGRGPLYRVEALSLCAVNARPGATEAVRAKSVDYVELELERRGSYAAATAMVGRSAKPRYCGAVVRVEQVVEVLRKYLPSFVRVDKVYLDADDTTRLSVWSALLHVYPHAFGDLDALVLNFRTTVGALGYARVIGMLSGVRRMPRRVDVCADGTYVRLPRFGADASDASLADMAAFRRCAHLSIRAKGAFVADMSDITAFLHPDVDDADGDIAAAASAPTIEARRLSLKVMFWPELLDLLEDLKEKFVAATRPQPYTLALETGVVWEEAAKRLHNPRTNETLSFQTLNHFRIVVIKRRLLPPPPPLPAGAD